MSIRIRRPVISSFFLRLSQGSFAILLSLVPCLITSPLWVPLTPLLLDGVKFSFARGGHRPKQRLLRLLQLLPPSILLPRRVEWHLMPSWHNLCAWMLALTISVMSCVRWTPTLVILYDDRLSWVISLLLLLYLYQLLRMRVMRSLAVLMRMMVLACPVMMRCLLDVLTLCHSWQKGGVVLIWE